MPVIKQEHPGRKEKVVFVSPLPYNADQALELAIFKPPPVRQQPAGEEEESVG